MMAMKKDEGGGGKVNTPKPSGGNSSSTSSSSSGKSTPSSGGTSSGGTSSSEDSSGDSEPEPERVNPKKNYVSLFSKPLTAGKKLSSLLKDLKKQVTSPKKSILNSTGTDTSVTSSIGYKPSVTSAEFSDKVASKAVSTITSATEFNESVKKGLKDVAECIDEHLDDYALTCATVGAAALAGALVLKVAAVAVGSLVATSVAVPLLVAASSAFTLAEGFGIANIVTGVIGTGISGNKLTASESAERIIKGGFETAVGELGKTVAGKLITPLLGIYDPLPDSTKAQSGNSVSSSSTANTSQTVQSNTADATTKTSNTAKEIAEKKPLENHHFFSNKNSKFTNLFKEITDKYGLDLDGEWNKEYMHHQGRHPNAYHEFMLQRLKDIDNSVNGDKDLFLEKFGELKEEIINHPEYLTKLYWGQQIGGH